MEITPVTPGGEHVRLEPVRLDHVAALWRVGAYEDIWRDMPCTIRSEEDMRLFIEAELRKQQTGLAFRFAILAKPSARPVDSTSYLNIAGSTAAWTCRAECGRVASPSCVGARVSERPVGRLREGGDAALFRMSSRAAATASSRASSAASMGREP
jgi:hypothetical protein